MAETQPSVVLVLDDDPGIVALQRRALERAGYVVDSATSEEAALEQVHRRRPDLLLLDYRLAGTASGVDVYRRLCAEGFDLPAVLVTGFSDENKVLEALRAGVRDVVPKGGAYLEYLPQAAARVLRQVRAERDALEAEALRASEERCRLAAEELQTIMNAAPDGILVAHDPGCFVVTGNKPAHDLLGVPEDENISAAPDGAGHSRYFRVFQHGREAAAAELPMQMAGATGKLVRDQELEIVRADGTRRVLLINAAPLRAADGAVRGVVGACTDITARKQAEQALRASEEKFRAIFERAAVGMGRVSFADARWIDVNDAFCSMLGYTHEEMRSTPWPQITHPDDVALDLIPFRRMAAGELDTYALEKRFIHKDGHEVWARLTLSLVRDARGRPDYEIAIIEDITGRKRSEQELAAAKESAERAKAAAEQASRAKDHFLAVLSHELRTPLTPVLAGLSLLQSRDDFDAETREDLEMIRRNVDMEARLIDDLLDVTRIARGKIELRRKPVQLCEIIRRAVEVCEPDIQARRLAFDVGLEDGPYTVQADPARLQQVFWNLLRNAIKFTPHGGYVGIQGHCSNGTVTIEVNDTGIGIEPDALPRLFNAFEQAERSITRQFGGLGLGLTISKALVEMHGGRIEAHSAGRGKGATFRVQLPLATAEPQPEARSAVTRTARYGVRILMVEDHGDTAKIMRMLLRSEGYTVESAGDVATALQLASKGEFDLLISDLGLPDASGLDLIRELRRRGNKLPGIALSGYGQEEDIRRSQEAGFAAHLTKPTSPERLIEAIGAALGISAAG
jgi:two-component system, chemotaxis family, CheB/CheR fusion protein